MKSSITSLLQNVKHVRVLLTFIALLLPSFGRSAEVTLVKTASVQPGRILKVVSVSPDAVSYQWRVPVDADKVESDDGTWIAFSATKPGIYLVHVVVEDRAGAIALACCRVTVSKGVPPKPPDPPIPPKPPDPPIPPKPPDPPVPPKPPAPIPEKGFRVLIVYKASEVGKMPKDQESVLYAKQVRDYLRLKCAPGPGHGWWILDVNADVSAVPKLWQDAMARPRTQVPWLIVSDGDTGFEGPLPANITDTMALLRKYGG